MWVIQLERNWHSKKQENKEEKKSLESDSELTWVLELIDKDIKTVIINALNMFKKLNEDMEDIKRRPKSNF